jgi:hypothetical protein
VCAREREAQRIHVSKIANRDIERQHNILYIYIYISVSVITTTGTTTYQPTPNTQHPTPDEVFWKTRMEAG